MTKRNDNLIVFDWNGTMIADTSACLNATNIVLDRLGLPRVTVARFRQHYTMPLIDLYHGLGVDSDILKTRLLEVSPVWFEVYNATKIRLRRGAKAMLKTVRDVSCEAVVLSNAPAALIEKQAKSFDVREHFDAIIAPEASDGSLRHHGKGKRLHNYLQDHRPRSGLIIGDSEEEVSIGREFGLVTIAITDGMCSVSRLRAMKPDFLVNSLHEIPALAYRVFGKAKVA